MDTKDLLAAISGGLSLINAVLAILQARRQTGEMTPEEEAEFDALVQDRMNQPWWKKSVGPQAPTGE